MVTRSLPALRKGDWIRFQIRSNKRVLEGFIQEISDDRSRIRVGKAPDSPEHAWHNLIELTILQRQTR